MSCIRDDVRRGKDGRNRTQGGGQIRRKNRRRGGGGRGVAKEVELVSVEEGRKASERTSECSCNDPC